ncbi:MAG: HAMP domain-containing sensor histidine kinase [Pseudomonadota bacterium]|nr:HAMP domain-containing sensor histidine kinase [Pseudomonadota bacterium]
MTKTNVLRSSTFRLALLYMLLSGGSVVILLGFIYWATAGYMDRQTDATIEAEIRGLAEQYRRRGLAGLSAIIAERVTRDPSGASVYLLADDDLSPVVGNLSRWPDAETTGEGWIDFRLRDWGQDKSEEHQARARTFLLHSNLRLLVGRDVRELEATRRLIVNALAWGLAITLALALGVGLTMSAGVTRRIDAINQTSREIMEGDLSRRVPTYGTGDDFDRLADNLNRMLERIEWLMESVRQVSDNIAHDLRTPLTRLRTKLELARGPNEKPAQVREAVDQAVEDAEELLSTFNALLRIARIESGSRRSAFRELDLSRLLRDVAEFYEPLASHKGQHLEVDAPHALSVDGDRDLLFQALANLVDNAVKYTPRDGRITLSATTQNAGPQVAVADTGPGIPAETREKVFQRFYRIDNSRTTPGSGLGLSLVQAVVQLHGARIAIEDNHPGLRAVLRFRASAG